MSTLLRLVAAIRPVIAAAALTAFGSSHAAVVDVATVHAQVERAERRHDRATDRLASLENAIESWLAEPGSPRRLERLLRRHTHQRARVAEAARLLEAHEQTASAWFDLSHLASADEH